MTGPEGGYTPSELNQQVADSLQQWRYLAKEMTSWDEIGDNLDQFLQARGNIGAGVLLHLSDSDDDDERYMALLGLETIIDTDPVVVKDIWQILSDDDNENVRAEAAALWPVVHSIFDSPYRPHSLPTQGCTRPYRRPS